MLLEALVPVKQRAELEPQLLEGKPRPHYALKPIPWL